LDAACDAGQALTQGSLHLLLHGPVCLEGQIACGAQAVKLTRLVRHPWQTGRHRQANRLLGIADHAPPAQAQLLSQSLQRLQQALAEGRSRTLFQAFGQKSHPGLKFAHDIQAAIPLFRLHAIQTNHQLV
jgi:hypothetical protein